MDLMPLCDVELRYTSLESIDFGAGGQLYGTMEGTVNGEQLKGTLRLTNLASRRPDNVNLPTLRGLLTTDDGASVWTELDVIAILREADQARVFVTRLAFRTGDPRYSWLNTAFAVLEGALDRVAVGGVARAKAYHCQPTIEGIAGKGV